MDDFERIVEVPKEDARRVKFTLKGKEAAVTFSISANWYQPEKWGKLKDTPFDTMMDLDLRCVGLGFHYSKPYGCAGYMDECDFMEGGDCYYDDHEIWAEKLIHGFLKGGTDYLWPELEKEYHKFLEREKS